MIPEPGGPHWAGLAGLCFNGVSLSCFSESSFVSPGCDLFMPHTSSCGGRTWCLQISEHPDSDFVEPCVNNAAPIPRGKRSADVGSTTAAGTAGDAPTS